MEVKKIEGVEYILKSEVDELVRKRLSPMSERARKAETQLETMQKKFEESQEGASRFEEQKARIEQLEKDIARSRAQYESHSTIAENGFIDPRLRDMVEWTYEREMAGRPKKSHQKLGEWLKEIRENPDMAPITIRPHLQSTSPQAAKQEQQTTIPSPPEVQASNPPASSAAVVQQNSVPSSDLITNALRDPEMYRAKRDEIKATWYAQRKKGLG